ncbi:response regulator transcription factor [Streptomyces sp. NPDC058239]|uniref:response regulator transcription factor n=1 Tax=Streptomyces sp. NPDC058239 TaxID=3346395 RepID=UPI0036E9ABE6
MTSTEPPLRVLVADGQGPVRTGFRPILMARRTDVAGEAADGPEAVAVVRELRPGVVLMNIRMPNTDGLEAARRVLAQHPHCRLIMLPTFDLDHHVCAALAAGAGGSLLKDVTSDFLGSAVRPVNSGDALPAPSISRRPVEGFACGGRTPTAEPGPPAVHQDPATLTPRERELMTLMVRGLSNAEPAEELRLSEATENTHVARIFAELSLRDRAQASYSPMGRASTLPPGLPHPRHRARPGSTTRRQPLCMPNTPHRRTPFTRGESSRSAQ